MQPVPERYSKLMHRAINALLERDQKTRSSAKRFLDWYASAREKLREAELALRGGMDGGRDDDGRREGDRKHQDERNQRQNPQPPERDAPRRDSHAKRESNRREDREGDRGELEARNRRRGDPDREAGDATMIFPAAPRDLDAEQRRQREGSQGVRAKESEREWGQARERERRADGRVTERGQGQASGEANGARDGGLEDRGAAGNRNGDDRNRADRHMRAGGGDAGFARICSNEERARGSHDKDALRRAGTDQLVDRHEAKGDARQADLDHERAREPRRDQRSREEQQVHLIRVASDPGPPSPQAGGYSRDASHRDRATDGEKDRREAGAHGRDSMEGKDVRMRQRDGGAPPTPSGGGGGGGGRVPVLHLKGGPWDDRPDTHKTAASVASSASQRDSLLLGLLSAGDTASSLAAVPRRACCSVWVSACLALGCAARLLRWRAHPRPSPCSHGSAGIN